MAVLSAISGIQDTAESLPNGRFNLPSLFVMALSSQHVITVQYI